MSGRTLDTEWLDRTVDAALAETLRRAELWSALQAFAAQHSTVTVENAIAAVLRDLEANDG